MSNISIKEQTLNEIQKPNILFPTLNSETLRNSLHQYHEIMVIMKMFGPSAPLLAM